METASINSTHDAFGKLPRFAIATAFGAIVATAQAHAADTIDAKPAVAAACDPYKNHECLDHCLGDSFWDRLANYPSLEGGQGAAPSGPRAPPARRDYFPPLSANHATEALHGVALRGNDVARRSRVT